MWVSAMYANATLRDDEVYIVGIKNNTHATVGQQYMI